MHAPPDPVIRFDAFELDTRSGELRKHGRRIRLPEQSFQVLSLLLAHPGEVVLRADLRQRLWPTATAGDFDSGLNNAVKKLRDGLGDSADTPRLVETLPRRGYRFLGKVVTPVPSQPPEAVREETASPSRPRFARWHAVSLLLLLLVGGAASYQRENLVGLVTGSGGPIRSIVVLPFNNLTGDAAQDYVADSVSAALTSHLAEVSGLDVISRTTAQQFKRTEQRIPDIGNALNVQGVVEGEVVRSGPNVRIMVKLIRASTDRNVWSRTYDGTFTQMIGLQQRIASDIAAAAGQRSSQFRAQPSQRTTTGPAYDAYLKGLHAKGLQRYEGFRRAVTYFEEAIALQPDFAEAHAELALSQLQFLFGGPVSPHDAIPRAETAAREALRIDDTIGQAHWALGRILTLYHWRWEEGDRSLQRAAALPGGRASLVSPGLARRGQFDEAVAAAERGRALDPLAVNAQTAVGAAYRRAGRYARAIEEYRRALEMSPQPRIHFELGVTFLEMGRVDEAIREIEIAARTSTTHNTRFEAYLGYSYAVANRISDARAVLSELTAHRRDHYVSSYGIALIHDALGEREPALAALERAYQDHAVEFGLMDGFPKFKSIASVPRYQAIMQSVGLSR